MKLKDQIFATATWANLDEPQRAVLRSVAGDNPGQLFELPAIRRAASGITPTQTRLALRRLVDANLISQVHAYGAVGYSVTKRGIRALAVAKNAIVQDEVAADRPAIAGHPLPWSIVPYVKPPARRPEPDEDEGDPAEEVATGFIVDADGYRVLDRFPVDGAAGKLWQAVVEHLAKPGETMADLALVEKAAKVAKLRLENERREGADARRIAALEDALVKLARTYLPKSPYEMSDCDWKARNVLTELGLGTLIWTTEASS